MLERRNFLGEDEAARASARAEAAAFAVEAAIEEARVARVVDNSGFRTGVNEGAGLRSVISFLAPLPFFLRGPLSPSSSVKTVLDGRFLERVFAVFLLAEERVLPVLDVLS